jgi:hypothetical protein
MNLRAKFSWHLREPFAEEFDRTHWWKSEDKTRVTPIAAIYELARRHPRIGQLRSKLHDRKWYGQELREPLSGVAEKEMAGHAFEDLGDELRAVHCLCLIGLKSWPMLSGRNQDYWEASAGKIKGVDCRDDIECCRSIRLMADAELFRSRAVAAKLGQKSLTFKVKAGSRSNSGRETVQPVDPSAFEEGLDRVIDELKKNPITNDELEKEIVHQAIDEYRAGHYLLSIAPDLSHDEARNLLSKQYAQEQKQRQQSKERARWNDWLPIIKVFEKDEEFPGRAKAPVFTAYRRLFENLQFE